MPSFIAISRSGRMEKKDPIQFQKSILEKTMDYRADIQALK
jgi:hypothetical protein